MKTPSMLTARERRLVAKLWLRGLPARDIGERVDLGQSDILHIRRRMGLPKRDQLSSVWTRSGGHMRRWLYEQDQLLALIGMGYSDAEIARVLARTPDGVRHERRKQGFPTDYAIETRLQEWLLSKGISDEAARTAAGRRVKIDDFDDLAAQRIRQLDRAEVGSDIIAKLMGCSAEFLRQVRSKHSIPRVVKFTCVRCGKPSGAKKHDVRTCYKCRRLKPYREARSRMLPQAFGEVPSSGG